MKASDLRRINKYTSYKGISYLDRPHQFKHGGRASNRYLYKYLDMESAIKAIKNGTLLFSFPSLWKDPFERRFFAAQYDDAFPRTEHPNIQACCFTINRTSEPAWQVYTYGKSGLGSRCVQLKINAAGLRKQLNEESKSGSHYYEGEVAYLSEWSIRNIHKYPGESYDTFFGSGFSFMKYLNLLLMKREAYSYEREFRLFRLPVGNAQKKETVNIVWGSILEDIKVSKETTDVELDLFTQVCRSVGIECSITRDRLYNRGGKIRIRANRD